MLHRVLSTLLAFAVLAAQLAAVPHVHAAQPADHATVRHIHLPTTAGHRHGTCPADHAHHGQSVEAPESLPCDHDHGCIHLPGGSMESTSGKGPSIAAIDDSFLGASCVTPVVADTSCDAAPTSTAPNI